MRENVKCCRLSTGEFVVSEVERTNEDTFRFKEPYAYDVVPNPRDNKLPLLRFWPLILLGGKGDSVVIGPKDIMFWLDNPSKTIIDKYMQAVTGIIPGKEIMIQK